MFPLHFAACLTGWCTSDLVVCAPSDFTGLCSTSFYRGCHLRLLSPCTWFSTMATLSWRNYGVAVRLCTPISMGEWQYVYSAYQWQWYRVVSVGMPWSVAAGHAGAWCCGNFWLLLKRPNQLRGGAVAYAFCSLVYTQASCTNAPLPAHEQCSWACPVECIQELQVAHSLRCSWRVVIATAVLCNISVLCARGEFAPWKACGGCIFEVAAFVGPTTGVRHAVSPADAELIKWQICTPCSEGAQRPGQCGMALHTLL